MSLSLFEAVAMLEAEIPRDWRCFEVNLGTDDGLDALEVSEALRPMGVSFPGNAFETDTGTRFWVPPSEAQSWRALHGQNCQGKALQVTEVTPLKRRMLVA